MLDRGLSEDGAAQALGWPKARVTARVKLLELPERAQQLIGDGVIHLAAVDQLRAIGSVAPNLLDAVIGYLDDGNSWAAERLAREPGWVLDAAMAHNGNGKVFAAYLHSADAHEITELRLGKKTEQLYAEAEKLHRQLDRYAYGPPAIRFTEEDVDQARAARVLIEFDAGRPIIVDRALYRELVKGAIKRTHDELQAKAEQATKEKKASRAAKMPADPVAVAKRERDAQLRALADQAHGANLDLGHALVNGLSAVDPADIDVARFFVFALLGSDHDGSPYTQAGEQIARIAAGGIRLVIGELGDDVTKTRKDGTRGRLRIDYGDHRDPQQALAWLWKFIDGAGTAGELYGPALVVLAAEQYATRLVVPTSQRMPAIRWSAHKDLAAKTLKKLAGPHVPASLSKLEQAVKRTHSAYATAEARAHERQQAEAPRTETAPEGAVGPVDEDLDEAE
jgi:hypothetical protein